MRHSTRRQNGQTLGTPLQLGCILTNSLSWAHLGNLILLCGANPPHHDPFNPPVLTAMKAAYSPTDWPGLASSGLKPQLLSRAPLCIQNQYQVQLAELGAALATSGPQLLCTDPEEILPRRLLWSQQSKGFPLSLPTLQVQLTRTTDSLFKIAHKTPC